MACSLLLIVQYFSLQCSQTPSTVIHGSSLFFLVENIVFQFFNLLLKMSSGASVLNESSH
jgi:hypothetical protein